MVPESLLKWTAAQTITSLANLRVRPVRVTHSHHGAHSRSPPRTGEFQRLSLKLEGVGLEQVPLRGAFKG